MLLLQNSQMISVQNLLMSSWSCVSPIHSMRMLQNSPSSPLDVFHSGSGLLLSLTDLYMQCPLLCCNQTCFLLAPSLVARQDALKVQGQGTRCCTANQSQNVCTILVLEVDVKLTPYAASWQ